MIFYTLQGPKFELEIHEDRIKLIKKSWMYFLTRNTEVRIWDIKDLSQFKISVPKFLGMSGKLEWETFEGEIGTFKFSTHPQMVKKIEAYLQKRVIKNHKQKNDVLSFPDKKKKRPERQMAA